MTRGASAPGKLVISGEYVVLSGAPALVAAVDRRAVARWGRGSGAGTDGSGGRASGSRDRAGLPREAAAACGLAEEICAAVPEELTLDVTALREGDKKLGLGSSAAGAAAAAGAVFTWHGHDVTEPGVRARILDAALGGHRAVAPEGSGADVAASVLGGLVRFERYGRGASEVRAERVVMPKHVAFAVVWTGVEARTSDFVRSVAELEARDRGAHTRAMDALREASDALLDAVIADDATRAVEATRAHADAMAVLGRAAGVPIVETRLATLFDLARAHGGAAKPSGAGGGDVGLAVFPGGRAPEAFESACAAAGMSLVPVGLAADGLLPIEQESE